MDTPSSPGWRLARATAPLAARFAGYRAFPLWALVHHVGRRTGRPLQVPVAITNSPIGLIVNLPYGPGTNWVRNVLAAQGCTIHWKGRDIACREPELLTPEQVRPYYSGVSWRIAKTLFGANAFLLLRTEPQSARATRTASAER